MRYRTASVTTPLAIIFLGLGSARSYAQLASASVYIDNKTGYRVDVTFTEIGAPPTLPSQTRTVPNPGGNILDRIDVPLLTGGTFSVQAFVYDSGAEQPVSVQQDFAANSFKSVEVLDYHGWYFLKVENFGSRAAFISAFGNDMAKDELRHTFEKAKESRLVAAEQLSIIAKVLSGEKKEKKEKKAE
jgi:hypothetical protein